MNLKKVFLAVFLMTLSVLMLELALTRLFSATLYYHLAFMAISLALFGSGASGVFIYIVQDKLTENNTGKALSMFAVLYSLAVIFALWVILGNPLLLSDRENVYRLVYRLSVIYAAAALPFFFAGCVISLCVTRFAAHISRVYLFDLAGAAFGCLLLIPVLNSIGAINALVGISAVGALAAVFLALAETGSKRLAVLGGFLFLILVGFGVVNKATGLLDVRVAKWVAENEILFSKWNSFSRITVTGDLQKEVAIKIDADAATTVVHNGQNIAEHQDTRKNISALGYYLKPNAQVTIIGPGGGVDVTTALVFGADHIDAVEINPIIARDVMLTEPFKSYSGDIYSNPRVTLHVDEGRSFIRRSSNKYDLIQATMVDTWAATAAGAFSLSENNLYTVEAFTDYAQHLSDDGLLTMTRWYFEPPDQLLRLVSISRAMMVRLNIGEPERHFVIMRAPAVEKGVSPATFIFKKSAFTDDEVLALEKVAEQNNFDILYSPLHQSDNEFTHLLKAENAETVWNSLNSDVSPTYDNNPFFFNSLRPSNLRYLIDGPGEWRKTNLGSFVLLLLFSISTVLVFLFIVTPLILVRKRRLTGSSGSRSGYLAYFSCLGAGFIIIEVSMIQKFILFLGHPVYALAVILFSLLLFSAVGSYLTARFEAQKLGRTLVRIIILLVGSVIVYIFLLPVIFYGLVWLPLLPRILISVVLLAPLSIIMGMPMPIGIKLLSRNSPEVIPWAWGLNGALSVMGSVATLIIAILMGFNQALLVGAAIYLLAAFFIPKHSGDIPDVTPS